MVHMAEISDMITTEQVKMPGSCLPPLLLHGLGDIILQIKNGEVSEISIYRLP